MRPTRVLYVEDDPALRGILSTALNAHPMVEVLTAVGSASDALEKADAFNFDVALLDLALGRDSMSGYELGLALRRKQEHIGIVLFSQHSLAGFLSDLPEGDRWGWSVLQKRADVDVNYLIDVLKSTARGLNIIDPLIADARAADRAGVLGRLSSRQREIMSLASSGLDATAIADRLGLAAVTIRQELSRVYTVLVPDPKPGTDLRTTAVLRYLRESREATDLASE